MLCGIKSGRFGQAWWLTPVIPEIHPEESVQGNLGQKVSEIPSQSVS
jgi:hypothetical protein